MATSEDIAWAAGLFEGEGCIFQGKGRPRKDGTILLYPRMTLNTTDQDVLNKFAKIVGVGGIKIVETKEAHWKTQYQWWLTNTEEVKSLLKQFRPYLGKRRLAKADQVLEDYENNVIKKPWAFKKRDSSGRFTTMEAT